MSSGTERAGLSRQKHFLVVRFTDRARSTQCVCGGHTVDPTMTYDEAWKAYNAHRDAERGKGITACPVCLGPLSSAFAWWGWRFHCFQCRWFHWLPSPHAEQW